MNDSVKTKSALSYDRDFEFPAAHPLDPYRATQSACYVVGKPPKNTAVKIAVALAYAGAIIPLVAFVSFIFALYGYFGPQGRAGIRRDSAAEIMLVSGIFIVLQVVAFLILFSSSAYI